MAQAADYFSYVFDQACALGVLDKLACQHAQGVFRARCLLHADGEFNVELHPFEGSNVPVQLRLANAPMTASPDFILHKTTHRPEYDRFLDQAQGAFDVLANLRWQLQSQDLKRGRHLSNLLDPSQLSLLQRHQLKDAFAVIIDEQQVLRQRFCREL